MLYIIDKIQGKEKNGRAKNRDTICRYICMYIEGGDAYYEKWGKGKKFLFLKLAHKNVQLYFMLKTK